MAWESRMILGMLIIKMMNIPQSYAKYLLCRGSKYIVKYWTARGSIFIVFFYFSIIEQSIRSGILKQNKWSIRSCCNHSSHIVSQCPQWVHFICICISKLRRKWQRRMPHRIARFFPYWVFPRYILCSFCG